MKKTTLFLFIAVLFCISTLASDGINGDNGRKKINIGTIKVPNPHISVDVPEAEYNTVAGTLTITLDAVSYSEYTITLSSGYANVDYYPTSATSVFPASALSEITYIYIDSDDCGTYEGVLDMNDIGNTY